MILLTNLYILYICFALYLYKRFTLYLFNFNLSPSLSLSLSIYIYIYIYIYPFSSMQCFSPCVISNKLFFCFLVFDNEDQRTQIFLKEFKVLMKLFVNLKYFCTVSAEVCLSLKLSVYLQDVWPVLLILWFYGLKLSVPVFVNEYKLHLFGTKYHTAVLKSCFKHHICFPFL